MYKALREEELVALRSLVRVFAMHSNHCRLSAKHQQRMLEDLCDAADIDYSVIEAERILAHDPVVLAVANCNLPKLRQAHHDASNDITVTVPNVLQQTEDDGDVSMIAVRAPPPTKSTNASAPPAPAGLTSAQKKEFQQYEQLAHAFVKLPLGDERNRMERQLEDIAQQLERIVNPA